MILLLTRNVDDWAEDHFGPVFAVEYLLLSKERTYNDEDTEVKSFLSG